MGNPDVAVSAVRTAGGSRVEPGVTPQADTVLSFSGLEELRLMCGSTRLDGGMHFRASVPAGSDLCDGLGTQTVTWAKKLILNATIPSFGSDWPPPPP